MGKFLKLNQSIIRTIKASAGVPSPAENYIDEQLDLNKYLIKNMESTFFIRVSGDSMIDVGIFNDDIIIVDKGLTPMNKSIVIVSLNEELVIKRLLKDRMSKNYYLKSENSKYPNIKFSADSDVKIWGVATYVIHSLSYDCSSRL